jgi:transcriptional regulator with XRE-family HTH domain
VAIFLRNDVFELTEKCLPREYGKVFKEFRIANGYTLEQASSCCCDRKTLWNFENKTHVIGLNIFCKLIENIKVPAMEFFSAVNNYQFITNNKFTKEMYKYYRAGDVLGLKKMLKIRKASNPKEGRLKRNWDIFVLSVFIHNLDLTFAVTDKVVDLATEYLLGIEHWSTCDLRAFANTLYIFNTKFLCL